MSITIHQVQSLLSTYHRQQVQSKLSDGRAHRSESDAGSELREDRVEISAEARQARAQNQITTEKVLKRIMYSPGREADREDPGPLGNKPVGPGPESFTSK